MGDKKKEVKGNKDNVIKMNVSKETDDAKKEALRTSYTVEEYNKIATVCNQMYQDIRKLQDEVAMHKNDRALIRLGYLFEVVKNYAVFAEFGSNELIQSAINEISYAMYPPDDAKSEKGK
jgi:gamma-glutamyl:cysteine ligase YbdK (ATP-grasp superfamily)